MTVSVIDWMSWSGKGAGPEHDGHPSTIYRSWIDKGPEAALAERAEWMAANGISEGVAWMMDGGWNRRVLRFWSESRLVTTNVEYDWRKWLWHCIAGIWRAHLRHGVTIHPYVGFVGFADDDHFHAVSQELLRLPAPRRLYCDRIGATTPGSIAEWRVAQLREDYGFEVIAEALPSQFAAAITDGGCAVAYNGSADRSYAEAGNQLFGPTTIYVSGDSMIDDAKLWIRRAAEDGVDLKLAANRPPEALRELATQQTGAAPVVGD